MSDAQIYIILSEFANILPLNCRVAVKVCYSTYVNIDIIRNRAKSAYFLQSLVYVNTNKTANFATSVRENDDVATDIVNRKNIKQQ